MCATSIPWFTCWASFCEAIETTTTDDKMLLKEVLINTGSRTLFQYLIQPIRNAFARSLIED